MKFKLFILLVLLTSSTIVAKVDKDFSLAVELEDNTLDITDPKLSKRYDDSRYFFWVKVIITNKSTSPKKFIYASCSGFKFEIESDSVRTARRVCKKNLLRTIWIQPKESYKVPLYLSFRKDYTGDTLKFRLRYPNPSSVWSDFFTIKLRR